MTTLKNPYPDRNESSVRIGGYVPNHVHLRIKRVLIKTGDLNNAFNILIAGLVAYMDKNGINTDADRDRLIEHLNHEYHFATGSGEYNSKFESNPAGGKPGTSPQEAGSQLPRSAPTSFDPDNLSRQKRRGAKSVGSTT